MPAVSDKSIAAKLHIKPGKSVAVINAPAGYDKQIGKLPSGVSISTTTTAEMDIIQVFVKSEAELKQQLPKLKNCLKRDGALWVTYYKGTSKNKTDINRDTINTYGNTIGLEGVAIMSIDDDWSALRLKIVS
jgi:hypothetical protein